MTSQAQHTQPALRWQMPIIPDHYDRSTLSPEEWLALEHYSAIRADSRRGQALQKQLARFNQPLTDLYLLRYQSLQGQLRTDVHRFMQRQVLRLRKMYWECSASDWKEILCPTPAQFNVRHARLNMNSLRVLILEYIIMPLSLIVLLAEAILGGAQYLLLSNIPPGHPFG
jgi:hypothetical protein